MRERRAFARIRLDVPASLFLYQVDVYHAGAIVDLSLGGCFFPIQTDLSIGEDCSIKLTTGEGLESETLELAGKIARKAPDGVGIQFTDLTPALRIALERVMSSHGDWC